MAHEFVAGWTYDHKSWHGLETCLHEQPDYDTAERLARWGEPTTLREVYDEQGNVIDGWKRVERFGTIHAIATDRYTPLKDSDAFRPAFAALTADGSAIPRSGMTLAGGGLSVLTFEIPGLSAEVVSGDTLRRYLFLWNGHNTHFDCGAQFGDVCVVCMNTARVAWREETARRARTKHTTNVRTNMDAIHRAIDVQRREFSLDLDIMRRLAEFKLDRTTATKYFRAVLGKGDAAEMERADWRLDRLEANYVGGVGSQARAGTVWGAFSAVTEFVTHQRGRTDSSRIVADQFGAGATLRQHAADLARELVGV